MDSFAVVTQGFLREALRVACFPGSFGPGVTVGMQRHSLDAQTVAPLFELRRAVTGPHTLEIGKQPTGVRTATQHNFDFFSEMDESQTASLLAGITDDSIFPVNLVTIQIGHIVLGAAQPPAPFINIPPLSILLPAINPLILLPGDDTFEP